MNNPTSNSNLETTYSPSADSRFVGNTHTNLKSDLIEITEDKLMLCLIENEKILKDKTAWQTPISLFSSLLLTKLTAKFETGFVGIDSNTWEAIFLIGIVISLLWLIISLYKLYKSWKTDHFNALLNKIKNSNSQTS